jgi:hypothetical protein
MTNIPLTLGMAYQDQATGFLGICTALKISAPNYVEVTLSALDGNGRPIEMTYFAARVSEAHAEAATEAPASARQQKTEVDVEALAAPVPAQIEIPLPAPPPVPAPAPVQPADSQAAYLELQNRCLPLIQKAGGNTLPYKALLAEFGITSPTQLLVSQYDAFATKLEAAYRAQFPQLFGG